VVELFGRNSGETALISAYLADVDRTLISELPLDIERLAKLIVTDKRRNPSNYAMVVISEGATMIGGQVVEYDQEDAYGHKKLGGIGQITGEALKKLTGIGIVQQQLAYLMRAGTPLQEVSGIALLALPSCSHSAKPRLMSAKERTSLRSTTVLDIP